MPRPKSIEGTPPESQRESAARQALERWKMDPMPAFSLTTPGLTRESSEPLKTKPAAKAQQPARIRAIAIYRRLFSLAASTPASSSRPVFATVIHRRAKRPAPAMPETSPARDPDRKRAAAQAIDSNIYITIADALRRGASAAGAAQCVAAASMKGRRGARRAAR